MFVTKYVPWLLVSLVSLVSLVPVPSIAALESLTGWSNDCKRVTEQSTPQEGEDMTWYREF